jgi:hypothetical protein
MAVLPNTLDTDYAPFRWLRRANDIAVKRIGHWDAFHGALDNFRVQALPTQAVEQGFE